MKLVVLCAIVGALFLPAYLQTRPAVPKKTSGTARSSPTPKRNTANPQAKATVKAADEGSEWDRVTTLTDRSERIAALQKYIKNYPKGTHITEASGLLAAARIESGNELVAAGNVDAAVAEYRSALSVAPTPVVEGFWNEGLIKVPANLFFHGRREAALDAARRLETKAGTNGAQLLSLATFYLTIEDGADAKRIAENMIAADPSSAAAYRMLGLAARVDFDLEGAAGAFAKALEIDPNSGEAREGLAEMKRALGKSDEALALYDQIIAKDPESISARTGRIMALFEANKRSEAEGELAKTLEAAPRNVILLASAAYWYAAHNESDRAIEHAQKAIDQDPRFIWSYIALSRGMLQKGRATDAEKTLIAARRYGNFPTLEYELAAARFAAGFYREAAETLEGTFQAKDNALTAKLGGRVTRSSERFTDLVADERRASIFAPTAADDADTAARLAALLIFKERLDAEHADETSIAAAADSFAEGSDPMRVHRQIFAASQLLEKKLAIDKAVELAKAATSGVDASVTSPASSTAVMASEIYIPRKETALRGEYVNVPEIPAATRSAILRGRIEDIIGWAEFQSNRNDNALIHLRRAVAVLPTNSAWWRTSTWHLGASLALAGQDSEALSNYIKSYKGSTPDPIRYSVIDALYRKVNGSADGLTEKIGPDPSQTVAQTMGSPQPAFTPTPAATQTPMPTAAPHPTPDYTSAIPKASPSPTPMPQASIEPSPTPQSTPEPIPEPTPTATPEPAVAAPTPTPQAEIAATPSPQIVVPTPTPTATPRPRPSSKIVATTRRTGGSVTREPAKTPLSVAEAKTPELFPPVIITIPPHTPAKSQASATPQEEIPAAGTASVSVPPCTLKLSEESITLVAGGGDLAIIVGRDDDADLQDITAESSSEADVSVRREEIPGVKSRALFVVRSLTQKTGLFQVTFTLPCGRRTLNVRVR